MRVFDQYMNKILDGLPCCNGTGAFRAPTRRARWRAPKTLQRRPSGAAIPPKFRGARRPSLPALAQQG